MKIAKVYSGILAAFILLLLAACGTNSSATGGFTSNGPVPFSTFLQHVSQAQFSDYAQSPTTKVQNESAFNEMRTHILKVYEGVKADSSYSVDGQTFDCVVVSSAVTTNPPRQVGTPGTQSSSSASTATSCKDGTFPMQRVTLEQLVQFPTLQAFLAKSPGGSFLPPATPSSQNKK